MIGEESEHLLEMISFEALLMLPYIRMRIHHPGILLKVNRSTTWPP